MYKKFSLANHNKKLKTLKNFVENSILKFYTTRK